MWTQFLRTIPISALKHTLPITTPRLTPRYGQYITHAQSYITRAVTTTDSCFVLIRTHENGIAPCERAHLRSSTQLFTAETSAKALLQAPAPPYSRGVGGVCYSADIDIIFVQPAEDGTAIFLSLLLLFFSIKKLKNIFFIF